MRFWERILAGLTGLVLAAGLLILGGALMGRPLLLAAVPTGSMSPALQPGDLIPILPLWAAGPPTKGTVIVFQPEGEERWIVHRIVDGDPRTGFVTKGDANDGPDPVRVTLANVAGVVPQPGGALWRLPGVGRLTTASDLFANPFIALALGAAGLLLLVGGRRKGRGRPVRRESRALGLYGGLILVTFLGTLLPAWALSTKVSLRYTITTERSAKIQQAGLYLPGEVHQETILVQNSSLVPVLVVYLAEDPTIRFDRAYRLIGPKSADQFQVTVVNTALGAHESSLTAGLYLPFLPPSLLINLARIHLLLAATAVALVPTSLVIAIALFDPQVRRGLIGIRNRLLMGVNL